MGQLWSDSPDEAPLSLEEELRNLMPITHRLLQKFEVMPYGVLGTRESSPSKAPPKAKSAVDAVIVDSAFAGQIGTRNIPGAAKHGRAAIYAWVGIHSSRGRFPEVVHNHFQAACDDDVEGRAKYHRYGPGQHVIHAVGPVLKEVEKSVHGLTETYANLLKEFCKAIGTPESTVPRTLRLLPISTDGLVGSKHLSGHVGRIFWSALCMALERLPTEMQCVLETAQVEVCIYKDRQVQIFVDALEEKRRAADQALCLESDMGAMSRLNGSYDWIRRRNGDVQRIGRLAAASRTFQAIWDRKYVLPDGTTCQLQHVEKMLEGTCMRKASESNATSHPPDNAIPIEVVMAKDMSTTVMDIAIQYASAGHEVAAVNAASGHHIGGGILTGGRHALEEAWCMTSTLLKSLQQAEFHIAGLYPKDTGYIPEDAAVLSPLVEVFRSGSDSGYSFLKQPVVLAGIVSVAMYNCNARVKDSPVDVPELMDDYEQGVRQKFRAMIEAAAETGADVLICPDVGCGVFENDPAKVGSLLGEVLREKSSIGVLRQVVVSGNAVFAQAAVKASRGEKVLSHWTPPRQPKSSPTAATAAEGSQTLLLPQRSVSPKGEGKSCCCVS